MNIPERVYERLMQKTIREDPKENQVIGCLVSLYSTGSHGYAQIGWQEDGKAVMVLAHRARWMHDVGPIPETIDHLCRNKRCIELTHLRLLTNAENGARSHGRDWPLGDGECIRGHAREWRRQRARQTACLLCHREAKAASKARKQSGRKVT